MRITTRGMALLSVAAIGGLAACADGANDQIVTLARDDGTVLASWGRAGRMAGQFKYVRNIAIDSKGNLYTAEVGYGRRAQKFNRVD